MTYEKKEGAEVFNADSTYMQQYYGARACDSSNVTFESEQDEALDLLNYDVEKDGWGEEYWADIVTIDATGARIAVIADGAWGQPSTYYLAVLELIPEWRGESRCFDCEEVFHLDNEDSSLPEGHRWAAGCSFENVEADSDGTATVLEHTKMDRDEIIDEALDVVKDNADGSQYVRVYLHFNNDKTEFEVKPHFFSNSQWDDIDQEGQFQLCAFEQSDLLDLCDCGKGEGVHDNECGCEPESFFDTGYGEDWIANIKDEIETNLTAFVE